MLPAACIVPEGTASPGWVVPLVPVFSPLVHVCASPASLPAEAGLRRLMQEGRLLALSPALSDSKAQHLAHLVRSLDSSISGSDAALHSEQLKQYILESLANKTGQEETAILTGLLRSGALEGRQDNNADLLWGQRLLLVLADQAQQEEEALTAALGRIDRQHQGLIATFNDNIDDAGDDISDHAESDGTGSETGEQESSTTATTPTTISPVISPISPANMYSTDQSPWQSQRLQAWTKLYAQVDLPWAHIWYITRQQGLAEQLRAEQRLAEQKEPGVAGCVDLPELLLPGAAQGENYDAAPVLLSRCPGLLKAFTQIHAVADMTGQAAIHSALQRAAHLFAQEAPAWNNLIRAEYAASTSPGSAPLRRLRLSVLPGMSFLQRLCAMDAAAPAICASAADHPACCLFGLLQD
ncbi:MAG: hypothetical protein HQQ73_02895 [Desulfobulbaceae bacterium]|nr:hypothetical protein [Desulfobulbaceae bacterium]